jgi:hypothetical protein
MKSTLFLTAIAFILFISACGSSGGSSEGGKKVVVWSSGNMTLDPANKTTITFEPGNRHNEETIELSGNEKSITVKTSSGDKTYDIPDNATYLLNLKADTIIGSYVNFGAGQQTTRLDAETLDRMIDSTQKLMTGEGASEANKSYNLPPNTIKKISANLNANLLSPYKNIPYEVTPDEKGNAPEYYKFFTNKQKREALKELIDRLSK